MRPRNFGQTGIAARSCTCAAVCPGEGHERNSNRADESFKHPGDRAIRRERSDLYLPCARHFRYGWSRPTRTPGCRQCNRPPRQKICRCLNHQSVGSLNPLTCLPSLVSTTSRSYALRTIWQCENNGRCHHARSKVGAVGGQRDSIKRNSMSLEAKQLVTTIEGPLCVKGLLEPVAGLLLRPGSSADYGREDRCGRLGARIDGWKAKPSTNERARWCSKLAPWTRQPLLARNLLPEPLPRSRPLSLELRDGWCFAAQAGPEQAGER